MTQETSTEVVTTAVTSGDTPSAEEPTKKQTKEEKRAARRLKEQEIYNNFATPLVGTFINLPKESVLVKCPSCGINEMSQVMDDYKWWATEINRLLGCLFVTFCCCCCCDYRIPCKQMDRSHYCKNCGCYFGRAMEHSKIKIKASKQ